LTRVKICGLTREEDVDAVVDAGADAVGFVSGFPNSPRDLSIERAAELISRVPPFVTSVLVTTGASLLRDAEAIKRASPKAVQLYDSGYTPLTVRASLHALILRPFAVGRTDEPIPGQIQRAKEAVKGYDALLTDTFSNGAEGGTGLTSDWTVCASIRKAIAPTALILSGGLRPENVELAVETVAPFCVDVSSGVESSPGLKDHSKVRDFVSRARRAEGKRVTQ
jgi:phosphoribosylanthranilate isomerase